MTTRIRKRGSRYEVFLDLGDQDALRCPVCVDKRGRGRLLWIDDESHEDCPKCHGKLEAVKARRERWIGSYATKTEARAEVEATVVAQNRGEVVQASKLTFAQFLRDWTAGLDDLVESGERKASTVCTYKGHVDNHIKPYLGHLRIQSVTPQWVDRFMRHLGKQDGRGGGTLAADQSSYPRHPAQGASRCEGTRLIGSTLPTMLRCRPPTARGSAPTGVERRRATRRS